MVPPDTAPESLGDFLRRNYAEILPRWLQAVRDCAPAMRLPEPALVDHLPVVLERIASAAESIARGDWSKVPSDAAVSHAMRRLDEGFELRDVVTEFFLLRQVLLELVLGKRASPDPAAESQLVCWAVDASIRDSVTAFTVARHKILETLDRVSAGALASQTVEESFTKVLQAVLDASESADVACLLLAEGDRLVHRAAVGRDANEHRSIGVVLGEGLVGRAAAERRPVSVASTDGDYSAEGAFLRQRGIKAQYTVPLLGNGGLLGVVQVGSASVEEFSEQQMGLLRAVAERISAIVYQQRLRHRAERLARERDILAQQRQLALDAARMGWWYYDVDRGVARYDRRFTEIFGLSTPEGRADEGMALVHPEDRERVWAEFTAALDPGRSKPYSVEYRIVRPDGELRWVQATGVATFEGTGSQRRPTSATGTATDITGRKLREEALRQSQARLRRLYESGMIGVCSFDLDGSITDANDKFLEMVGYSRDDLRAGRVLWDRMTPPEYRELDARALDELRASGVDTPYEKEFIRKDGSRVFVHVGAALFDDARHHGIAFAVDVTSRKEAEAALREANEKLKEADRRKNEFLGMLSHELRNPLAPIRNSLYVLERVAPGGEQARRAQAVISRQVGHLSRLIDDLLDVTRISRGKIRLQRERVDLVEVVRRTVEDHRTMLDEHEVRVSVPSDPVWVDGDAVRLAQILANLVQNSAKFTEPGGTIAVSVEEARGRAVVGVSDSGIGIDSQTLSRLFEPFSQADRSLERTLGGLGLGLALVKGLTELHGGSVRADSEGPGRGARFTLELPLGRDERASKADAGGKVSRPSGHVRRVLIIEDNRDAADSLAEALLLSGHEVQVAYRGEAGIERAREYRPDVVVCDIGLPDMDGYAVAAALRRDPTTPSARLIALSGYARPEDSRRALEAGFEAHLKKPPDLAALDRLLAREEEHPAGPV